MFGSCHGGRPEAGARPAADLAARRVPAKLAAELNVAKSTVAQGIIPRVFGRGHPAEAAVISASHQAVTTGLHVAFAVIAGVAPTAAFAALGLIDTTARRR